MSSARNQIVGSSKRIVPRGPEAEAIIRTGGLAWIVSLVAPAVAQLELEPGAEVHMIIKGRSCHVTSGAGRDPLDPGEAGSVVRGPARRPAS